VAAKTQRQQRVRGVSRKAQTQAAARHIWIALLLALATLVYARSLSNQFVYDDNEEIRLNHFIGQWSFIWRSFVNDSWWFRNPARLPQSAYYRPLQDAWFALNYHAFAMNPVGWHLTMIALEVVVVWLVFRIAEELTNDFASALVAAAIFAAMPVHAQAIAWPSAIPLPLSAAFELGALLIVVERKHSLARAIGAPILFGLALLSHESAIVFPLIVVAYRFWCGAPADSKARERIRTALAMSAPFFLIAILYLCVRVAVLGFITRPNLSNHMTPYSIALTIFEVVGQYLLLLVIPWRADPAHMIVPLITARAPVFYMTVLGLSAILLAAWTMLAQRGRVRLYAFCFFWMLVALAPVLNLGVLSPVELVADRYLYMPSAAWCIALGGLAGELMAISDAARNLVIAVITMLIAGSAAILWNVESYWHDEIALFSRAAAAAPDAWLWHERLGMALKSEGRLDEAIHQLAASNALDRESGSALYNIALIHLEQGHSKLAFNEMVQALPRIKDAPPQAYGEAARLAMQNGDQQSAERLLEQASKLPGGESAAAIGRAEIKLMQHDAPGAVEILRDATAHYPQDSEAWALLARTQVSLGEYPEALIASEHAVAYSPNSGWYRVLHAQLLATAGRHDEAAAEYQRAVQVQPDDPELRKIVAQASRSAVK
jgi:tetratricopeptide (TPR) repeat protein